MFDFSIITSWVHGMLTSLMPLGLAVFVECVVVGLCLLLEYTVLRRHVQEQEARQRRQGRA